MRRRAAGHGRDPGPPPGADGDGHAPRWRRGGWPAWPGASPGGCTPRRRPASRAGPTCVIPAVVVVTDRVQAAAAGRTLAATVAAALRGGAGRCSCGTRTCRPGPAPAGRRAAGRHVRGGRPCGSPPTWPWRRRWEPTASTWPPPTPGPQARRRRARRSTPPCPSAGRATPWPSSGRRPPGARRGPPTRRCSPPPPSRATGPPSVSTGWPPAARRSRGCRCWPWAASVPARPAAAPGPGRPGWRSWGR